MSLTSHLKSDSSPVRDFFRARFPEASRVAMASRAGLSALSTMRPIMPVPWSTVGIALDYRIRYYFGITPQDQLVAWLGARKCTAALSFDHSGPQPRPISLEPTVADSFFSELGQAVENINPVGRRLGVTEEAQLVRYCYALALFEEIFRAGTRINSPLLLPPKRTVAELLAIPAAAAVDDLCDLLWLFHSKFADRFGLNAVLNPTFDGSSGVGGADADLILDGCLIDIKATVNPRLDPNWFYQLLGYTLLDYTDYYGIQAIGIYLARQGVFLHWSVEEILAALSSGNAVSLAELRAEFQRVVAGCSSPRLMGQVAR